VGRGSRSWNDQAAIIRHTVALTDYYAVGEGPNRYDAEESFRRLRARPHQYSSNFLATARRFTRTARGYYGEWDPKQHALAIRFTVPLQSLAPGKYDCRVTVLDPQRKRTTF